MWTGIYLKRIIFFHPGYMLLIRGQLWPRGYCTGGSDVTHQLTFCWSPRSHEATTWRRRRLRPRSDQRCKTCIAHPDLETNLCCASWGSGDLLPGHVPLAGRRFGGVYAVFFAPWIYNRWTRWRPPRRVRRRVLAPSGWYPPPPRQSYLATERVRERY